MRARGINYDTGFLPGLTSRPQFDPAAVEADMAAIATALHCDAVRVSGGDPHRLEIAARAAAAVGLEVWFAPFPVDVSPPDTLDLYADCAARAEKIRAAGAEVVFVAGCESSAFGAGFLPGDTYAERLQTMATADIQWWTSMGSAMAELNGFLAEAAATVRRSFGGLVTYAGAPWEFIDWTPFDLVSVDAYRAAYNRDSFREELRGHLAHGKPVAVTEYGTCPYQGASDLGGMAWQPPEDAVPDEGEQVRYFNELLDVFESEGIDTALWFSFARFNNRGRDLGSYGVVTMIDETRWQPRELFHAMASRYREQASR